MKKWRSYFSIWIICVLLAGIVAGLPVTVSAAKANGLKRWNIVFVTDESKSMDGSDRSGNASDPDNLRYDAIKLFTQEITDKGNFLGSVSFAKDVLDYQEMQETNGKLAKDSYVDRIASVHTSSYTNIGGALMKAVELLENGNSSLDSAIILLSDGNTFMPKDERELSHEQKADAVEICRQRGIKIFTICLNVNHDADVNELKQIANATGGEFTEVDSAADLPGVETFYYQMLFSGLAKRDEEPNKVNIGPDGSVSQDFTVPRIGVEELNILIEGAAKEISFTDPSGEVIDGNQIDDITTHGNGFIMTKLIRPESGKWQVTAYGDPNAEITLRYMNNSSFYIESSIEPASNFILNSPVTIYAEMYDGNGRVTDPDALSEMLGEILLESDGEQKQIPMSLQGDRFAGSFTPDKQGTIYATATVSIYDMSDTSQTYEVSVDNDSPVPPEKTPKAHANLWPIIGGKASIELGGTATDPNGDKLTYSVENTAFNPDDYTLDGTKLTVKHYSIGKGSFLVKAADPHGAYCTFDVLFTSTNIGLIMAILTLVGILVALVIFIAGLRKAIGMPFMGTISVCPYDPESMSFQNTPVEDTPGRGRRPLIAFGLGPLGFAKGTYFQATGKAKKVIFKSKKPFYTESYPGGTKSLDVPSRMQINIYPTPDMKNGITVGFRSILDPDDGGFMFN